MASPFLTDRFIVEFLRTECVPPSPEKCDDARVDEWWRCGAAAQPVVMCPPRTHPGTNASRRAAASVGPGGGVVRREAGRPGGRRRRRGVGGEEGDLESRDQ